MPAGDSPDHHAVRGPAPRCVSEVIGVVFEAGPLPPIDDAPSIGGDHGVRITAEVQAHLGTTTVRALALQSAAGLRRRTPAEPGGGLLDGLVGKAVLGRLIDVSGTVCNTAGRDHIGNQSN